MKKILILAVFVELFLLSGCAKQEPQFLIGDETLEVELLNEDGSPLGRIEVDLWRKDTIKGPPDAGYAVTGEDGLALFKVPEGEYQIGFNLVNFPRNLVYPEKEPVIVKKGVVNKKTIKLNVKKDYKENIEESSEKRKLVALGASFAKGNNPSSDMVGDYEQYSYSTGTKINSIYMHLLNKGEEITAVNLAESGASSKDILEKQVPNAAGFAPKYTTLSIGGPDILEGVSVEEYEQNLEQIIKMIEGDDSIILIATIPDFPKMRTASFEACKEDKLRLNVERLTEEKIRSFNQVIKEVASKYSLILVDLFDVLGPEDVSDYDCLHPNIDGQEKIAQEFISALGR